MNCVICFKQLGSIHFDIEPLDSGDPGDRCCLNCRIFIYEVIINQSIKKHHKIYIGLLER